ncbi:hypothetical protein [Lysobacter niastensis]|uniref:Uncharacterized protein n=1 Tax=Lysobacter niastensis TaxID=380629 RepID=A0ABS0B4C1_9GAMM|nr:hypothetical protein [Lysobacter niastensis]MBF6023435.1 hypothetical protein [Lysobacter niastensis]
MQPSLHTAANGHLTLEFGTYDSALWSAISNYLEIDLGFSRTGQVVVAGTGEGVRQGFQQGELTLDAGWDNWSGDYLLSNSAEGDDLLRRLLDVVQAESASRLGLIQALGG